MALRFTSLTAGRGFTCGLSADSVAGCWGANQYAQLGALDSSSHCNRVDALADGPCSLRPFQVAGGHRFVSIEAGNEHVCTLDGAGAAYCWGKNVVGEFGVAGAPDAAPRWALSRARERRRGGKSKRDEWKRGAGEARRSGPRTRQ